ncbi:hypothetical protein [Yersinia enterocolitica]|uniref:hypothetical protein n=1 Tax=Yersinia enterocolitica TaxID=630 RepID=UPI00065A9110|nr:hypothetical protein [Yersinia enterocolitica]CRY10863.1 Uncharacterised protein [Yersinia enterocolitica]
MKINWKDKNEVIAVAGVYGAGMVVIKIKGRDNYNIVHASRKDLYMKSGVQIIHRTDETK